MSQDLELLIEGCRKGDRNAQRILYNTYSRKLYGVCLRYASSPEDAQDALQEVFIKIFQKIGDYRGQGAFEGWMRTIAVRQVLEMHRKQAHFFQAPIEQAEKEGISSEALSSLSVSELMLLINALPTGYRTVFNLYAIEGYSHEEIGELLGISSGTSKSQLSRARAILQEKMEQREYVSK